MCRHPELFPAASQSSSSDNTRMKSLSLSRNAPYSADLICAAARLERMTTPIVSAFCVLNASSGPSCAIPLRTPISVPAKFPAIGASDLTMIRNVRSGLSVIVFSIARVTTAMLRGGRSAVNAVARPQFSWGAA